MGGVWVMDQQENNLCSVVQDLIPIYADGELSRASNEMVQNHLKECKICSQELKAYKNPLLTDLPVIDESENKVPKYFYWPKLQRVAWVGIIILLIGTGSLTYAAYHMGKSASIQDPIYQRAVNEDLFVEIHQTKKLGPYDLTVSRLLLDNAQTVIFYNTNPAISDEDDIRVTVKDQEGGIYEPLSGTSYGGKEHVRKLKPVAVGTNEVNIEFTLLNTPEVKNFVVEVDPSLVLASTSQWWPNITKEIGPIRFDLEHVILGLTKSQVNIRALWPLDEGIRGIGFSMLAPMGPKIGEDGRVTSASGGAFNIHNNISLTGEFGTLVDVINKRQINLKTIGYQTDSFTGGINASFDFEPIKEPTSDIEFSLPAIYLYHYVTSSAELEIALEEGQEKIIEKNMGTEEIDVLVNKITVEDSILSLEYSIPSEEDSYLPNNIPEFVLINSDGFERQGRIVSVTGKKGVVDFYISEEDTCIIKLQSLGQLMEIDRPFFLKVPNGY